MTASSPLEKFLYWADTVPNDPFLRQPMAGVWHTRTFAQAADESKRVAAGLLALGLKTGDHVAILSKNCAEWILADLALMMAGFVSIPIYPTLTAEGIRPILVHSQTKAIIAGKLDDFSGQAAGIPEGVISIGVSAYGSNAQYSWEKLVQTHQPISQVHSWDRFEPITIVYTSGTTGNPKGVMHCINAMDSILQTATKDLHLPQRPVLFSYLPISHIAERMGMEINSLYAGGCLNFAESLDKFADNLSATQPHLFFAVPRIWIKFRETILQKMPQKKLDLLLSIPIINNIVRKKIKAKLGLSRASFIASAAAPLATEVMLWYKKLGIHIMQAYAMTEDCCYGHFNWSGANKYGTVGKALTGLQVKIADDGEIRVKSPGNTLGYYREPELTAELFDEENYLRTGDIGEYDNDGYLTITGRVKDQFKTDKGKYISPAPLETQLLNNHFIDQVCVVGTGIPQPIALITLSDSGKKVAAEELNSLLDSDRKALNSSLEKHEKIEKLVILKESWSIENGLLTPSLKVKRNELEKIFLPHYPTWYQVDGPVIYDNIHD
ncbi:MAG TPA: AMP-binding protein [Phnomibacter sp.]|nr:AMP-binding protein [Phnomibacter sp.]